MCKNIRNFYLKIFIFLVGKFTVYLNRHVFVMCIRVTRTFRLLQTYNGENVVWLIGISFLIGSSSNLQITRTCIKSWTRSILAQFRLLAFEGPIDLGKCPHNSDFIFDKIFIRLADNEDSYNILEGGRSKDYSQTDYLPFSLI